MIPRWARYDTPLKRYAALLRSISPIEKRAIKRRAYKRLVEDDIDLPWHNLIGKDKVRSAPMVEKDWDE